MLDSVKEIVAKAKLTGDPIEALAKTDSGVQQILKVGDTARGRERARREPHEHQGTHTPWSLIPAPESSDSMARGYFFGRGSGSRLNDSLSTGALL